MGESRYETTSTATHLADSATTQWLHCYSTTRHHLASLKQRGPPARATALPATSAAAASPTSPSDAGLRYSSMQAEPLSLGPGPEEVLYLPEANMPLDQRINLLEEERDTLVGGCHKGWPDNQSSHQPHSSRETQRKHSMPCSEHNPAAAAFAVLFAR